MTLQEYLTANELSDRAFGELIDRAHTTVMRIKKGTVMPDPDTMRRIVEATRGAVTPNDLFGVGEAAQ